MYIRMYVLQDKQSFRSPSVLHEFSASPQKKSSNMHSTIRNCLEQCTYVRMYIHRAHNTHTRAKRPSAPLAERCCDRLRIPSSLWVLRKQRAPPLCVQARQAHRHVHVQKKLAQCMSEMQTLCMHVCMYVCMYVNLCVKSAGALHLCGYQYICPYVSYMHGVQKLILLLCIQNAKAQHINICLHAHIFYTHTHINTHTHTTSACTHVYEFYEFSKA
jgi:hypothetical protein